MVTAEDVRKKIALLEFVIAKRQFSVDNPLSTDSKGTKGARAIGLASQKINLAKQRNILAEILGEPIIPIEPLPAVISEPTEPETVFVNIFNKAGVIISSGKILMSNVIKLRAAGQRVDIIEESEVTQITVPESQLTPKNPFIRDVGTRNKTFIKTKDGKRVIKIIVHDRISPQDRARLG